MPARIDEVNGDAILYVHPLGGRYGKTIVIQTDEAKAMYFDLGPDDVRALVADLGGFRPAGPATGCEHPECVDADGVWDGCLMVGLEHRMEGAHDGE